MTKRALLKSIRTVAGIGAVAAFIPVAPKLLVYVARADHCGLRIHHKTFPMIRQLRSRPIEIGL